MLSQFESLHRVKPDQIPSMVDFPIKKILDRYPDNWGMLGDRWEHLGRGIIWDMGFGNAKKAEQLDHFGFSVGGYDINSSAVIAARKRFDFFGELGDVRYFGLGEDRMWDTLYLEMVDALLFQAVFSSLLGETWKDALDAADMILAPGRDVFVGDFMMANNVYPELFTRRELLCERTWKESASRWQKRYEVNQKAFADLDLPYGTFAVAAPGPRKFEIDWSQDHELLRFLYDSRRALPEGFERFARHLEFSEFDRYLTEELGYLRIDMEYVPRKSRSTTSENRWTVAPGFNVIYQKGELYKYHPWRQDLNIHSPDLDRISAERKGSPFRGQSYFQDYYQRLLPKVRNSQKPIFNEMARLVGVSV